MTRLAFVVRAETEATVLLATQLPAAFSGGRIRYRTRTGALARVAGAVVGAFDAKHDSLFLGAEAANAELTLEVERRSLPIAGLPAGDGLRWRYLLAIAAETAARFALIDRLPDPLVTGAAASEVVPAANVAAVGHAHLDVAWLWAYSDTRRKALRTFATAVQQLDRAPYFRFAQSQPQLWAFVESADPALFARAVAHARGGRIDASVAALWVEPDANVPSGESLLRQLACAARYAESTIGVRPTVAWLPDTFGFPATLPTLLAHAGVPHFATTKLQWNDTTRFPHARFVWRGPDGEQVTGALLAAYGGDVTEPRLAAARERDEPLVVGYGDGGGGVTDAQIAALAPRARFTGIGSWMESIARDAVLPVVAGELYLETHRGTLTTHHDVKAANAALERALDEAEEAAAWCVAVRLAPANVEPLARDLQTAWRLVLRGQFHDVLAGTSTALAYTEVREDHERAMRIALRVRDAARSLLPRVRFGEHLPDQLPPRVAPTIVDDRFRFDNGIVRAGAFSDGSLRDLAGTAGPSLVERANRIVAFHDTPKAWDAWNLDRGYERKPIRVHERGATIDDDALVVHLQIGRSPATMEVELREGEPWLRVRLVVDWHEERTIVRVQNRLAIRAEHALFGQPHGSLARPLYPSTAAERARFEVAGQRFASIADGERGLALLTSDLYGWSALGTDTGADLGLSLLRAPRWPDPTADRGETALAYALVPHDAAPVSALEAAWRAYALAPRVRLFEPDGDRVLVTATKPADDGDGVIVRVRECDGIAGTVRMRCGGRVREVLAVDGCERAIAGSASIDGERLVFGLAAFGLRAFRVRF